MKPLQINWQRLVNSEGETCVRCGSTHENIIKAVEELQVILKPLNIEPVLIIKEISNEIFNDDPSQSNKIQICKKPIEEWLGAQVASSCCDSVCNGADCRTMQVNNQTFETIPKYLIIKAAIIAAAELIDESFYPIQ